MLLEQDDVIEDGVLLERQRCAECHLKRTGGILGREGELIIRLAVARGDLQRRTEFGHHIVAADVRLPADDQCTAVCEDADTAVVFDSEKLLLCRVNRLTVIVVLAGLEADVADRIRGDRGFGCRKCADAAENHQHSRHRDCNNSFCHNFLRNLVHKLCLLYKYYTSAHLLRQYKNRRKITRELPFFTLSALETPFRTSESRYSALIFRRFSRV